MRFMRASAEPVMFFRLSGTLAAGTALDSLHTAVDDIADAGIRTIVLDLAGVTRLDCWGIGELIRLHGRATASGRRFGLINMEARQRKLLDMVRLSPVLGVLDTPSDALGSAGPAASPAAGEPSGGSPRRLFARTGHVGANHLRVLAVPA